MLADFLNFYNHQRPHSALDGQPPITRTRGSDPAEFTATIRHLARPTPIPC
ncbi:Integrase core domain-containing protein [Saccharopolyspora shandongensis]|uniref:Integrase core domain-containing protein n=1 Tax=Saccharopolyspora shandongensis TaxID=418495 RepID=A0A1H3PJZ6_9PSEU|nr:Integrase core domain-containing protein [Saccharopolyspora shandongensis]